MRGDADQVADVRNRRASIFSSITLLKMVRTNNTRFGRSENALGYSWSWSGSVALVNFSSLLIYAEISAWHVKFNTVKLKLANFHFCGCSTVVIDCCTPVTSWKQVRFFIEYGIIARLEERTEHCMPALWVTQATKTIIYCTLAVAF